MQIVLLRADASNGWQPLAHLARALDAHEPSAIGVIAESADPSVPLGTVVLPLHDAASSPYAPALATAAVQELLGKVAAQGETAWLERPGWRLFALPLSLPPRILLLGAGPDARPVLDLATRLDWKVTLVDHRESYAMRGNFPDAERVLLARPETLPAILDLAAFRAAVVMSHHLPSDLAYLRVLARSPAIGYVGLLGPAVRRARLLADLGAEAEGLKGRLRAPVGLTLGGRSPESIALAIVAQLHAFLHSVED